MNQKINYNFSSRTTTYGPGSFVLNVNKNLRYDAGAIEFISYDLQNILATSQEFEQCATNFRLFKIQKVQVSVFPDDAANNENTYMNFDVFSDIDETNIETAENTKIINNELKWRKDFRFRMVNAICRVTSSTFDTINVNPRQFQPTNNYAIPGQLHFFNRGTGFKLRASVYFRILFKMPISKSSSEVLQPIIKKIEKKEKNNNKIENNVKKLVEEIDKELNDDSSEVRSLVAKEEQSSKIIQDTSVELEHSQEVELEIIGQPKVVKDVQQPKKKKKVKEDEEVKKLKTEIKHVQESKDILEKKVHEQMKLIRDLRLSLVPPDQQKLFQELIQQAQRCMDKNQLKEKMKNIVDIEKLTMNTVDTLKDLITTNMYNMIKECIA